LAPRLSDQLARANRGSMLEVEGIDNISDEMRAVVESE
jgi:hypothetical protein